MSITYPLIPPGYPSFQKIKLSGQTQTALSQSPFSGAEQVYEWPAEWWLSECALPPMSRTNAELWNAMLLALRGRSGTLLLGDSAGYKPQGVMNQHSDILRYTEQFDNPVWVKDFSGSSSTPTVTANAVNDPNGNLTADAINFQTNTGGAYNEILQASVNYPRVAGKTFTFSVYLKVASGTAAVTIYIDGSPYDPSSVAQNTITVTSSWARYSVTVTYGQTTPSQNINVIIRSFAAAAQTVYAWGAWVNPGSTPTTYTGVCGSSGPYVNGAGQTGKTLALNIPVVLLYGTTVMKAGDYLQLGTGTSQRLYKLMTDLTLDGSGNATADIFPRLRESPANQQQLWWNDARGTFRLAQNERGWDIDEALIYGINFKAIEAI